MTVHTELLHEATWYPAEDLVRDLSDGDIEQRLGGNETAEAIWKHARPLLNASQRAEDFWEVVPTTPLLKVPDECLPGDIQGYEPGIYFLADGMMPSGAYKLGGVMNALLSTLEQNPGLKEVHVASTGNHAAATALAAMLHGLNSYVYMPHGVVQAKVDNSEQYGTQIRYLSSLPEAVEAAQKGGASEDAVFIHPYNQLEVIAGQGSATARMYRQLGAFGINPANAKVFYPMGGIGDLAGNAVVGAVLLPGIQTFGAQAKGYDPAVDGAAVAPKDRGAYGLQIIDSPLVRGVRDVELGRIGEAMAVTAHFTDVYEPAGALALAAVLEDIRTKPDEGGARIAHGSGINTTAEKVLEFARHAYNSEHLSGQEAHWLVSQAGVDRRRRNRLEEQVRALVAQEAGTAAIRQTCRIASGV